MSGPVEITDCPYCHQPLTDDGGTSWWYCNNCNWCPDCGNTHPDMHAHTTLDQKRIEAVADVIANMHEYDHLSYGWEVSVARATEVLNAADAIQKPPVRFDITILPGTGKVQVHSHSDLLGDSEPTSIVVKAKEAAIVVDFQCSICKDRQNTPGALLFSPPVNGNCIKWHVCNSCYEGITTE